MPRFLRHLDVLVQFRREVPPRGDPGWARFEAHIARQNREILRVTSLCVLVFTLVFWPIDFLVARGGDQSVSFVYWRVGVGLIFFALYLLLPRLSVARRAPEWFVLPFSASACALLAAVLGANHGLDGPWFYNSVFLVIIPIVAPIGFGARVVNTLVICVSLSLGFFGANPSNLDSPWLPHAFILMATLAVACLIAGHGLRLAAANGFFQQERIAAQGAELEALNSGLDARVRAQTADLRALSEHLQTVREVERTRIARDLHDDLGQRLAATRYALANASRALGRGEDIAGSLDEVSLLLGEAATVTHEIVAAMRPPLLEQLGLHGACAWLTRQMADRAALAWDHACSGDDGAVDAEVGLAAYRALQEGVTNAVRHARGTRVDVVTAVEERMVTVTVTDDGVGLGASRAPRAPGQEGVGLIGVRERARALGGDVDLRPGPAGGVRFTVRLPRNVEENLP